MVKMVLYSLRIITVERVFSYHQIAGLHYCFTGLNLAVRFGLRVLQIKYRKKNLNLILKQGPGKVSSQPGPANKALSSLTVNILKNGMICTKTSFITSRLKSLNIGVDSGLFRIGLNSGRREISGYMTA